MKHAKPVTVAALAAMLVATAATTAACSSNGGTTQAGQAATVGSTTITNSDLNDWVSGVLETLGQPKDTANPNTTTGSLNVMIYLDLLDDLAAKAGVVVTPVLAEAAKVGVTVSPRYGTWQATTIKLGAPPNDLSVPAPQSS